MNLRLGIAVGWGAFIGGLTFAAGPLTAISASLLLGAMQYALTALMIPGLFASAIIGSLMSGAAINFLLHFGLVWVLFPLFARLKRS